MQQDGLVGVSSQKYPVVLLLSFSSHCRTLLHEKVQVLLQGLFTGVDWCTDVGMAPSHVVRLFMGLVVSGQISLSGRKTSALSGRVEV